jgi:hypothetical protein
MEKEKIVLEVPSRTARAYRNASPEQRRRAGAAVAASLMSRSEAALELRRIMDEMSDYAEQQCLTPEDLDDLLSGDA